MIRLICLCLLAGLASLSWARQPMLPAGFTQTLVTDPASGKPVHVALRPRPGAPWVVLIHGLGQEASNDWIPVLPALSEKYQILMFDLPGFGRSGQPDAPLTPRKYADLVHWLVSRHAREPVFVVGHSLGGAVALRYTHDYPIEVKRLLLIDAAGLLQPAVLSRFMSKVDDTVDQTRLTGPLVAFGNRVVNSVSGKVQDIFAGNAKSVSALAGSDLVRGMLYKDSSNVNAALGLVNEDFSALLPEISTPVWMLWGERDPVAPLRTAVALRWLLPQTSLNTLLGVGHMPMEDAPRQTAQWMLASLEGGPPGPRLSEATPSQGDAQCRGQKDMVFSGRYRSLRLERCTRVRIENATIESLVVKASDVVLENVAIHTSGVAIEARSADISATGLRIVAGRAMSLEGSRIDLAAAFVTAPSMGLEKGGSRLFFSLGHWCDGRAKWRLHTVLSPRVGDLAPQLRTTRDGDCALDPREQFQ